MGMQEVKADRPQTAKVPHYCRFSACQAEELGMEEQSRGVRKTYKYKLKPTPAQERLPALLCYYK